MSNDKQLLETFTKELRKFGVKNILNQQQIANQLHISNYDFITIQILEETGPITAGEIAKRTGISTGSVTALLDRLEKEHYIRRERDPNDRRKVLIVPQYDDKQDVQELYNDLNLSMLGLFQSYDSSEQGAIIDFLEKASDILENNREQNNLPKIK
ncbi:MarR family winged helix-turn-helix transcriptional regulator [Enterococcus sp. BWR-S5]|uniref:MarR family winged helix-turn-helix transcriptional regulator n=1 Tax=Enterococcus sp. BWR-S5 TaxID=2787714 RepID=UPI0019235288|nr:MarR family transcriptional regulator [Enterococcus sp. BWR-S5]MBL1225728.1 MarR family transcriptional regulator [Enterococcus sp. BWR-S5]